MKKPKWGGFLRTHQKFETKDPWPQVPFADDWQYVFSKWEAALYVVAAVVLLLFVLLGPGEL
jgi:hypothetical protein